MGRSSKYEKKRLFKKSIKKTKKKFDTNVIPKSQPGSCRPVNYLYGAQENDTTRKTSKRYAPKWKSGTAATRKGKKKSKTFVPRFPVVCAGTKVPIWFKGLQAREKEGEKRNQNGREKKQKSQHHTKILNAITVNESALQHLNKELEGFATYVRLSETEKQAREYLIKEIRTCCKNIFGVDDSHCQVFGSFAAQSVCIFESDVDLAIWGVVEPDGTEDDNDDAISQPTIRRDTTSLKHEKLNPNRKKQERVSQWTKLIDNAMKDGRQEEQIEADDSENKERSSCDDDSKNERNHCIDEKGEAVVSSIYIVDRIGDTSNSLADLSSNVRKNGGSDGCVDDSTNSSTEKDGTSMSDDSADKLENFEFRFSNQNDPETVPYSKNRVENFETNSDEDNINDDEARVSYRRPRGQSLVSLSSSTTCSVEAKLDESGMEVSFVVEKNKKKEGKKKIGPTGRTRTFVISSLYKLTKPLRQHAKQMNVRRKARVPIINLISHFGFECDIAIGGHNGADTSSYASNQTTRFKSFPVLIVLLKVLLSQHGLDKPFTGGIGSYSLYVLLARHIEQHLALEGDDNPAEILYTFFFRYGAVKHSNPKIPSLCRTALSQNMIIKTQDGGSTDLKSCFKVDDCEALFGACWRLIHKRINGSLNKKHSILQFIIDATKLEIGRSKYKKQVESKLREIDNHKRYRVASVTPISPKQHILQSGQQRRVDTLADREAKELIKGYGQDLETFIPIESFSQKRKRTFTRSSKKKKKRMM